MHKVGILAICLSFRLAARSPHPESIRDEARIFSMASQKDSRRASLVRTQADSPRRTGMTVFGFIMHLWIDSK